jgi:hypothetical protein
MAYDWPTNLLVLYYMLKLLIKLMVLFNASTFCAGQGVCVYVCVCGIIYGDNSNIPFREKNRSLLGLLFLFLVEKTENKIETNTIKRS